jgi:hypothetical protein
MISDVLFDAVTEIEKWQKEGAYDSLAHEISVVKTAMDGLRTYLDAGPGLDTETSVLTKQLREAIGRLDVSGITTAPKELVARVNDLAVKKGSK